MELAQEGKYLERIGIVRRLSLTGSKKGRFNCATNFSEREREGYSDMYKVLFIRISGDLKLRWRVREGRSLQPIGWLLFESDADHGVSRCESSPARLQLLLPDPLRNHRHLSTSQTSPRPDCHMKNTS